MGEREHRRDTRDGTGGEREQNGNEKPQQLTEVIRPVAEAAVTARLDCRKAFLNMMDRERTRRERVQRTGEQEKRVDGEREKREREGERRKRNRNRERELWMEQDERSFFGRVLPRDTLKLRSRISWF